MNEPQNAKSHRAPLAPGEIRTHTVGDRTFQVMHVAGGSFTQATARTPGQPTEVLRTDTNTAVAVRAYADAIAAAEAVEMIGQDALTYNLPDGADMALATGEPRVIIPDPGVQVEYATDDRPAPRVYTVQIEAQGGDGNWRAVAPAETVDTAHEDYDVYNTPDGAAELARDTWHNQTIADGEAVQVCVWDGADADVFTAPVAVYDGTDEDDAADEDDPAALLAIIRDALFRHVPGGGEQYLDRYLAAVAAQMPQPAISATTGEQLQMHPCGSTRSTPRPYDVHPEGTECDWCHEASDWQPLYILGGSDA